MISTSSSNVIIVTTEALTVASVYCLRCGRPIAPMADHFCEDAISNVGLTEIRRRIFDACEERQEAAIKLLPENSGLVNAKSLWV